MMDLVPCGGPGENFLQKKFSQGTHVRALEFRRQELELADLRDRSAMSAAVHDEWVHLVLGFSTWLSFLSLTIDSKRRPGMTAGRLEALWRRQLVVLNTDLYGARYHRLVGRSYFGFAKVVEKQRRGEWHLHALVDRRIHFQLLHDWWNRHGGYAWIEPVSDQTGSAVELCKYIVKSDQEPDLFRCSRPDRRPAFEPLWFSDLG